MRSLCHSTLIILFIYTFLLSLCRCSFHKEAGIVTTGGQNLYKHVVHNSQILVLDPEERYSHPRSLSKCRFLFPGLTSQDKAQESVFFYGTSPFLQFIDKETETKRGMVTCPGASGVGLRPDPTLVMFSAGPPAPSPPPALSQILHL